MIFLLAAILWCGLLFAALALARANRLEDGAEFSAAVAAPTVSVFAAPPPVLASVVAGPVGPVTASVTAASAPKTVYVVDDDPGVLELVSEVLKMHGYQVKAFSNPQLAADNIRRGDPAPELLVTDQLMPEMTGLELIANMRETCPRMRSVVISGSRDATDLVSIPLGSDAFVQKPFTIPALMDSINSTMTLARN